MSRIGNKIIEVPDSVKVDMKGNFVTVTGPKGSLERTFLPEIEFVADGNNISVKGRDNSKRTRAFTGLCRTLLDNMIIGTTDGYQKKLLIEGVGYRVELKGKTLNLNVGFSNPVLFDLPEGISATVEKTAITLDSIDKELLGQTAAQIREIKKPEPYKGKGIRYSDEHIVRKAGKTASK